MSNTYLAGNLIRVACYTGSTESPTGGFRDQDGNLTDPTTVTLSYRPGAGQPVTVLTYPQSPLVRDATGLYHADLDTTPAISSATWTYEWTGTGTVQAAAANAFIVELPYL